MAQLHQLRPLLTSDLTDLFEVQLACYGAHFVEDAQVFERRLASPANCSLALELDGRVLAYLAAYRTSLGKVTPLHGDFATGDAPNTLYLHDLAVHPRLKGQGAAGALLRSACDQALRQGLIHSSLVSVQDSATFWRAMGYVARTLDDPLQQALLEGYGAGAVYMEKRLSVAP